MALTRRFAGKQGPDGVLAEVGEMHWRSDGGVTASGFAVCAAGETFNLQAAGGVRGSDGTVHFSRPGLTYPWHTFPSALYFALATLGTALLGLVAAALACAQPLPTASSGNCCEGRRAAAVGRALALPSIAGHLLACAGLVRTCTVACKASAHQCTHMLPVWWVGALLAALGAMVSAVLVAALSPPPASQRPRLEERLAYLLRLMSVLTALIGLAGVIVTAGVHPFNRLAGLYVFCILQIVMPVFGIAGATLLLNKRRPAALAFLMLNTLLVGTTVIGLPVTAAGGYGPILSFYLFAAIVSLAHASLSLALGVLLMQATSADEQAERAGLAMGSVHRFSTASGEGDGADLHGQLAASERRVEEMDRKMATMIEQQARLMEMIAVQSVPDRPAERTWADVLSPPTTANE